MDFEVFIPYDDSNDGILLNCYKEQFSLIQAYKTPNGDVYKKWVYPQTKDRQPSGKTMPQKISLGNEYDAQKILKRALAAFDRTQPAATLSPESDLDIPF